MAGKWHEKPCPVCGQGTLHDETRMQVVDYRGEPFAARRNGAFCDNCGDGMVYHDPAAEKAWTGFRARVDADQAKELASIRTRLQLTQEQASQISGGGHNAFSRYERQEAQPVMGIVNLFRLLDKYPILLGDLLPDRRTAVQSGTIEIADALSYTTSVAIVRDTTAGVRTAGVIMFGTRGATTIEEAATAMFPIAAVAHPAKQRALRVTTMKVPAPEETD